MLRIGKLMLNADFFEILLEPSFNLLIFISSSLEGAGQIYKRKNDSSSE